MVQRSGRLRTGGPRPDVALAFCCNAHCLEVPTSRHPAKPNRANWIPHYGYLAGHEIGTRPPTAAFPRPKRQEPPRPVGSECETIYRRVFGCHPFEKLMMPERADVSALEAHRVLYSGVA